MHLTLGNKQHIYISFKFRFFFIVYMWLAMYKGEEVRDV